MEEVGKVELTFELIHKVGSKGYDISEVKVKGAVSVRVKDTEITFRETRRVIIDLSSSEAKEEKILKEALEVKDVLTRRVDNFKNNLEAIKKLLGTLGAVEESILMY